MQTLPVNCYCLYCDAPMSFDLLSQHTTVRCPHCDMANRKHVLTMRTAIRFLLVDYAWFLVLLALCNFLDILTTATTVFIAVGGSVASCLVMAWLKWKCRHG